jgi:hypothetical protein
VFLFQGRGLGDAAVGFILLVFSLFVICSSLVSMVKLLNSMLRGSLMSAAHRLVNAELPGHCAPLTGYAAMLAGAALTVIVQSSSVFTSMLTPLVGVGVVSIERVYPLTLGSNLGTTTTGLFAALAAPADRFSTAVQIALCHLLFNLTGILLFYPVPALRIPIRLARAMGNTTATYRWFAVVYLLGAFFVAPLIVFGLSSIGPWVLSAFIALVLADNRIRRHRWLPPEPASLLAACSTAVVGPGTAVDALLGTCRPGRLVWTSPRTTRLQLLPGAVLRRGGGIRRWNTKGRHVGLVDGQRRRRRSSGVNVRPQGGSIEAARKRSTKR